MKLLSTEIDEATIQLTYTDGQPDERSKELFVVRLPLAGESNMSLDWHQWDALSRANEMISVEVRRLRAAMQKA